MLIILDLLFVNLSISEYICLPDKLYVRLLINGLFIQNIVRILHMAMKKHYSIENLLYTNNIMYQISINC